MIIERCHENPQMVSSTNKEEIIGKHIFSRMKMKIQYIEM
jgi:hypothetical protein